MVDLTTALPALPLHPFCQGYIIKVRLSILFVYYFVQLPLSCGPFGINLILAPSISQLFVTDVFTGTSKFNVESVARVPLCEIGIKYNC